MSGEIGHNLLAAFAADIRAAHPAIKSAALAGKSLKQAQSWYPNTRFQCPLLANTILQYN